MRPVHRRPPRVVARQFLVWFAWFVLSGYVFHNRTECDLRDLSILEVGLRLASLGVVLVVLYWLFAIVPGNVRAFLAGGAAVGFLLGAFPLFVQASVTKYLELRQVWP